MATRYVARFPIKHGVGDETLLLDPGEELDSKDFTEDQIRELVASGSALPKDVADALSHAEKAQDDARRAQEDAQRQADSMLSDIARRDAAITEANAEQLRDLTGQSRPPERAPEKAPERKTATTVQTRKT